MVCTAAMIVSSLDEESVDRDVVVTEVDDDDSVFIASINLLSVEE